MAGLAQSAGVHSVRPTLPESFVEQYGYSIRASTFDAYLSTYGMKELTCFVEGPSAAHRDPTTYPGATRQSRLFDHLYEPIWTAAGSVNTDNYYAYYLYRLLQVYGGKVRFWEVVNEPDFTYGGNMSDWLNRPPLPDEVPNLQAPIFHYIRMLRISYEVIKRYRPDAYVTVGGVGYPQFVDALLRYTDNPAGGAVDAAYPRTGGAYIDALSFHSYPAYSLHTWDNNINGFRYTRTSDYAANQMLKDRQGMATVLAKYGYGSTYPAKHLLMSETNIGRRTSGDRTGSDEMQRNYGLKVLVLAQKNNIRQLYLYELGESVDAPAPSTPVSGGDELALMGLFENMKRDAPGAQRITEQGQAVATTSKLLYGWSYDAARTTALALPAGADGAAFSKNGTYTYVLWAKALTDNTEAASATYSFPAAWGLNNVDRYEWNHAATTTKTTQSAQGIALTGTPLFFTASGVPLPVELSAFTATAAGYRAVRLAWATASEKNSAAFEVERSLNGTGFDRIGTVAAAGTSTAPREYALTDARLPAGTATLYYRLKQVDQDGTSSYSPVRTVTPGGGAGNDLTLAPNPGRNATLAGAVPAAPVQVFDAVGRLVLTATADTTGTARLVLPAALPAGVYVVRTGARALRLAVE